MNNLKPVACVLNLVLITLSAPHAQAQCQAPAAWFPHETTPEPDFHSPASNCEFHQWGWQTFLWLTQPTGKGRIRLIDMPRAEELFMPAKAPATLNTSATERFKKKPLILTPRVIKREVPTKFGEIRQAGSEGVLVDQKGRAVYYAVPGAVSLK